MLPNSRKLFLVLCLGFVGSAGTAPALASDLEERLQQLEAEIEVLREEINRESDVRPEAEQPDTLAPAASAKGDSDISRNYAMAGERDVRARYFLASDPLPSRPPSGEPMAEGLVALDGTIQLNPSRYGGPKPGILNRYRDASVHRAAGLLVAGHLDLPRSGEYRIDMAPKPAREGGGSPVINEMRVYLEIDGEVVLDKQDITSWRRVSEVIDLEGGVRPFSLWVVSNSPGFGPPPIDSTLELGFQTPGRAEVTPLYRLVTWLED